MRRMLISYFLFVLFFFFAELLAPIALGRCDSTYLAFNERKFPFRGSDNAADA